MAILFPTWPFEEDEEVTIHWISSPKIMQGKKKCTVYLRTSNGVITPLLVPWGILLELWIGRKFINNTPIIGSIAEKSISLSTTELQPKGVGNAANEIPRSLYPLIDRFIFSEKCCAYQYGRYTYIIPCVEIARVFFGQTTVLANQLLSSGGLEELIDASSWEIHDSSVRFMFRDETPGISNLLAGAFAVIYGTPSQKQEWENTRTQYASSGLIETCLPNATDIKLHFIENQHCTKRFVYAIEVNKVYPPFKTVTYGPCTITHTSKSLEQGSIDSCSPTDDSNLDVTGDLAKRTHLTTKGSSYGGAYLDGLVVKRISVKDNLPAKVKVMASQNPQNTFAVGDISGVGKQPFISFEMQNIPFNVDPDFKMFCDAVEMLGKYRNVSVLDITYTPLPPGKWFSTLNSSLAHPRKYACVMAQKGNTTWLIIELCNKDGYSISTLFTTCPGNKEKLVNIIIDKLMISNGSWVQDHFPKYSYKTLNHQKSRSTTRWAELMYSKMA